MPADALPLRERVLAKVNAALDAGQRKLAARAFAPKPLRPLWAARAIASLSGRSVDAVRGKALLTWRGLAKERQAALENVAQFRVLRPVAEAGVTSAVAANVQRVMQPAFGP